MFILIVSKNAQMHYHSPLWQNAKMFTGFHFLKLKGLLCRFEIFQDRKRDLCLFQM